MKPRLQTTRRELGLEAPDIASVVSRYKEWVDYPEYLVFQWVNNHQGHWTKQVGRVPPMWISDDVRYTAALASKRGNRVYRGRLKSRLSILDEGRELALSFFARGQARKFSSYIFATLTYARDDKLGVVWDNVGKDFNRWITGIRKKYGKCEVVRCWEAHKDGYPHIHVLMIFHDYKFTSFRHKNRWRIHEKKEFEWGWGWVDVQAMESPAKAFKYITKYIRKAQEVGPAGAVHPGHWKAVLTMALTWFYRRRSWSCSRSMNDLIRALRNSNRITSDTALRDDLDPEWRVELLGFWGGGDLPPWGGGLDPFLQGDYEALPREISRFIARAVQDSDTWTDFRRRRKTDPSGVDMEVGE